MSEIMNAPNTLAGRLRHLGPGIIVAGSVIGSGELVLTASLGAVVGFGLLWFLLLSCWSKSIVQSELAHLCILNNETFLGVSNRMPGKMPARNRKVSWLIWYFFFNTFVALLAAGGILGGASQAIQLMRPEWSLATIAVVLSIVTALIIGSGSYKLLEKLLLAMVSIFTAITVYCSVALQMSDAAVSFDAIAAAQSFDFPIEHIALIVAVFSFTGVNIGEAIYYSYFCLDKGYADHIGETKSEAGVERAKGWLRVMHTDVVLTLILLTVVTVPFYVLGASVLHAAGMEPGNANMIAVVAAMVVVALGRLARQVISSTEMSRLMAIAAGVVVAVGCWQVREVWWV